MKRQIEIEDSLEERVQGAIEELKERLSTALKEEFERLDEEDKEEAMQEEGCPYKPGDLLPDIFEVIHEIADSFVPIYTYEIEATWFLHSSELEEAYENAGFGENPRENSGMTAIFCYIEQELCNFIYSGEEEDYLLEEWNKLLEEWEKSKKAQT